MRHEGHKLPWSNGITRMRIVSKLPCLRRRLLPKWLVGNAHDDDAFFRRMAVGQVVGPSSGQPQTWNVAQSVQSRQRTARATPEASSAEHHHRSSAGLSCLGLGPALSGDAHCKDSNERVWRFAIYPRAFRACQAAGVVA